MALKLSKRIFDIGLSAVALVAVSPFLVLIAVSVRLTSPGPVLYANTRVGLDGKVFKMIKFRTMVAGAELFEALVMACDDPRITPMGRTLRRTKLDELPNLWNVLKGDMSMVGPRPETPQNAALYSEAQRRVWSVRPGVTSMATVKYRHEEDMLAGASDLDTAYYRILQDKLELDLDYIERQSFWLDVRILGQTLLAIFK